MKFFIPFLILATLSLGGCKATAQSHSNQLIKGQLVEKLNPYGRFIHYVPNSLNKNSKILVIVHGSLEKNKSALHLSRKFIKRWIDTAEKEGIILIAPAFNRRDYQSYGGYRGLFGRNIGADQFVNDIIDSYKDIGHYTDGKFFLYGHSAGGQFAIRYAIRHPHRIIKAVISAPGRYAFPDQGAPWPYGMGVLQRDIKYKNPKESKYVDIRPDYYDWVKAAELPITIIVGDQDLEKQPKRPGHRGQTRIDLATNWAYDMNKLAKQNGMSGTITVKIIPGIGHSSKKLTPHCIDELFN